MAIPVNSIGSEHLVEVPHTALKSLSKHSFFVATLVIDFFLRMYT